MSTTRTDTVRELVGHTLREPALELPAQLTDSDTGMEVQPQRASSSDSVEEALALAQEIHDTATWADLPADQRAAAVRALQVALAERVDRLARADSLDNGVPLAVTSALLSGALSLLELAATRIESGYGHTAVASSSGPCDQWRLPWGPVAIFLPWNGASVTAVVKTAEALVAGCPVIIKPSEWAPHFSGPFAEAVRDSLPAGVVQVLHGDREVGARIVEDQRVAAVSFTGGVAGGRAVAEACARQLKPSDLELSGNNPVVVLPDADPADVIEQVVAGMLFLNGQYCAGPRRLVVHESRLEEHLSLLADALDRVVIGPTSDAASQLGPLSHEAHRQHVEGQLATFADRGCDVRRFGTPPQTSGHWVRPAVVLGDPAPDLQEEVFGPVLVVRTYRDPDEAVAIANAHPYGLTAHVFGQDRDAARAVGKRLRAGWVKVGWVLAGPDVSPVGSLWGASGLGSIGLGEAADFMTGHRFVG